MKPSRFSYSAPASLEECVVLLQEHGPDAKPLAGGQSLVPLMNLRLAAPSVLVDLARIRNLDRIDERDGYLTVGALTRHATVAESDLVRRCCPLLVQAASLVGYPAIRARGTMGGSLAHADPAAELPLAAVTMDADVRLLGPDGSRWVDAREFFRGYFTTALEASEVLAEVRFPTGDARDRWAFEEFSRKSGDFAVAAAAVHVTPKGDAVARARIGVAGAADRPVRAPVVEASLKGRSLLAVDLPEIAEAVANETLSDGGGRGHEERRELIAVLVRRALERACVPDGEVA